MMKTILIEPICKGKEHNEFIANFIKIYSNDNYVFFSQAELAKNILAESYDKLYYGEASFLNLIYFFLKEKQKINVYFLSINKRFVLYSILFLFFRKINIITIIPHAILNEVYRDEIDKSYKAIIKKILTFTRFGFLIKLFLSGNRSRVVVLGKSIALNLIEILKIKKNKVFWIHHPYDFCDIPDINVEHIKPKKIGFVGVPSKDKGFPILDSFLKKENYRDNTNNDYQFIHVGPSCELPNNLINRFGNNGFITRYEFENALNELHYIIMPLPYEEYVLRASGTFFDAVKFEKPIIYSKNPFIQAYVDQIGQIGVEFDFRNQSLNELFTTLNKLDYVYLKENIKHLKKKLVFYQKSTEFMGI